MKKYILVATIVLMVGCKPIPVKMPFPEPPRGILESKNMNQLDVRGDWKLSELLGAIAENNEICRENKIKLDMWNEWYYESRKIYEKEDLLKK